MVMGSRVDGSLVHVKDGNIADVKAELQVSEAHGSAPRARSRTQPGTAEKADKQEKNKDKSENARESISSVSGKSKDVGKGDQLVAG